MELLAGQESIDEKSNVPVVRSITRLASTNVCIKPEDTVSIKPDVIISKRHGMIEYSSRETVTLKIENNIAVMKIDLPNAKENVLNEAVADDLRYCMDRIDADSSIKGIVIISGKPNTFIAGADIGMLSKCKNSADARKISSDGQRDFFRIENSQKPVVAAIMGTCMGGGLELVLACHYRIAMNVPKTLFALPEVKLGLLPGAGGTQRLPKLIPITEAISMMLTGKTVSVMKAKKIGLIDRIVQPIGAGMKSAEENNYNYLEQIAVEAAQQLSMGSLEADRRGSFWKKAIDYALTKTPVFKHLILKKSREKVMKMTVGNYPAPLKILDVIESGITKGPDLGYLEESEAFGDLTQTTQCKALMNIFKGRTECKRKKFGESKKIEKLAIIGAGLMGAGIANVSVDKNIQTYLLDRNDEGLARGQNQIQKHYDGMVKRKKISDYEKHRFMANLKTTCTYDELHDCDVAIEAVFEELSLKHEVIKKLESVVPEHCIIASNTSALPITKIASVSTRPERIIGMHYFSPVERMELLEIITTKDTSKEAIAIAAQLGLTQNKLVVVVKDCPGFFVVRCLAPMMSEVVRLLQEGVHPDEIDEMTKNYGFPVGAATLADEVGIDVAQHVAKFLGETLGARVGGGSLSVLEEMIAAGFKGRKSGKGYFVYDGPKKFGILTKKKPVNEAALRILQNHKLTPVSTVSSVADRQLRILCRYVNEAIICLEEGIISSPLDGDTASVFGIGFPPFLGGPFRFVDIYGADKLMDNMLRFAEAYSLEQFKPAQIIQDHAKRNAKFYPE
uniref:Trifunctional enzyme subunit alpha, mitochondrial n=1 Tax=Elaeophora elaphi TaxID=1147741 RepID=A0A0R3S3Q5_9BILA